MRHLSISKSSMTTVLGLALTFGLTGCKDSERDRILMYKKGTYLGSPDRALSDDTLRQLQNRTRYQFASGN
jgi:hypothetical protein